MKALKFVLWLVGMPFRAILIALIFPIIILCFPNDMDESWKDIKDIWRGGRDRAY